MSGEEFDAPVLVGAFEGWNDAGEAATSLVEHLAAAWDAKQVSVIDPDDYYDFQVNRPLVTQEGEEREIVWPTTRLLLGEPETAGLRPARPGEADDVDPDNPPPLTPADILLLRGVEPNMRWRTFCDEIVTWCREFEVVKVILLGALLADTPHTRPVPVSGSATDPLAAGRMGLEISRYEGPTGIVGVLQDACTQAGLPAASFWAAVPHYVAQPPCPKATVALLGQVEDLLEVSIDLGDLPEEARAWERGVDELAAEDTEVAEYVRSLEEAKDTAELPEASGEAIAREFERYLRRRGTDGDATGS
jgi:hypothetical protein